MLVHVCDGSIVRESHCGGDIRRPHPAEDTVTQLYLSVAEQWPGDGIERDKLGRSRPHGKHNLSVFCKSHP